MLPARSLGTRLAAAAAVWIGLALISGGVVLSGIFSSHVEEALVQRLVHDLDRLAAGAEVAPSGALELSRSLPDPLYEQPYSGRYWQLDHLPAAPLRSRSLWDAILPLPPDEPANGEIHRHEIAGPAGQRLLVVERGVALPDSPRRTRIAVAADRQELDAAVAAFDRTLMFSLGVLWLALAAAATLQVRFGLRPLRRLRVALRAMREGRAARLAGDWPEEVAPLVADLNAVLEHDRAVVERARTHAGNLAHALKTPLSVLANEASQRDDPLAQAVRREVAAMRRHVDHHLARARAAAAAALPGVRTDAVATVSELMRAMSRLHQDRRLAIESSLPAAGVFRGEREDFAEMAGNLVDNACKWARSRVRVTVAVVETRLVLTVEDDGPGLAEGVRDRALARGVRLDESMPGSGFGLSIVRDLAELYGGSIVLAEAEFGGLKATLTLPAA